MKPPYRLDDPRPPAVVPPLHAHTRAGIALAANAVRERAAAAPDIAIILGTGLGGLGATRSRSRPRSTMRTSPASRSRRWSPTPAGCCSARSAASGLAMQGRFHLYEGYRSQQVTFPVRVLHALGAARWSCRNACGGHASAVGAGDLMLIADHINLLGDNPLIGPNDDRAGAALPRHVGALRSRAPRAGARAWRWRRGRRCAKACTSRSPGPSLETRAEYRMLRALGADVVGMSTVPEVIVGVHAGMRVLGISIITDQCLPDALEPATVERIIATANAAEPRLTALMRGVAGAAVTAAPRFRVLAAGTGGGCARARNARAVVGRGPVRAHAQGARGRAAIRVLRGPADRERPARHPPRLLAHDQGPVLPLSGDARARRVPRKAGWDTHGLPVEIEVEKQLGLSGKPEIEKYGVAEFNSAAARACGSTRAIGRSCSDAHRVLARLLRIRTSRTRTTTWRACGGRSRRCTSAGCCSWATRSCLTARAAVPRCRATKWRRVTGM